MAATAHGQLTASAVKRVDINPGQDGFVVVNRSQSDEMWVRFDGQDPTVGGDGSYVVIGSRQFSISRRDQQRIGNILTVRLLSAAALKYSVEAVSASVASD